MVTKPPARRLPPLHAIAAFDAAARHGSFLGAAEELAVTPSAISHRIRILEAQLQFRLFLRGHRSITLTPEGERYWGRVRRALAALEEASGAALEREARRVLRLQAHQGIGATWLSEQLVRYQEHHPEIDFLLSATYSLAELKRGGVDIAIRYGEDDWSGLVRRPLLAESVFPVASRALIERVGLRQPSDLRRATLLRHPQLRWTTWFRAAGLEWPEPTSGLQFDDVLVMMEAAARDAGVCLAVGTVFERSRFVDALTPLFALRAPDTAYYLVLSEAGRDKPWVREFAAWLIRRAKGDVAFEPV
jgi:LysR family glycine cleavage system transcriptional activator